MGSPSAPFRRPLFDDAGCLPVLEWLSAAAHDRCCYCGCETWLPKHRRRRLMVCQKLGIPYDSYGALLVFEWRMATVEHVQRRVDGGGGEASNLALACAWCNSSRHDNPAEIWAIVVAALIAVGRHPCVGGVRV